jgi:hypothetical protein
MYCCYLCNEDWEEEEEMLARSYLSNDVQDTVGRFKQAGAVCQELLLRQAQVSSFIHCSRCLSHVDGIRDISAQVHSLGMLVDATATRMIREARNIGAPTLNVNLFSPLPNQDDNNTPLDFLGRTILHRLLDRRFHEGFSRYCTLAHEALIDAQSVKVQDRLGRTQLHLLCQKGPYCCVKIALESGADPSNATIFGHLPLHYAAQRGNLKIFELLLEHKEQFDVSQEDKFSQTALRYARYEGHTEIEELLIQAGAKE